MTMLEEGLYTHLMNQSAVTDLISTRLYPLIVPQDADLPAVAYQRITGAPAHSHEGPSGLARARIQLTIVAASYSEAKAVAEAVRQALDGKRRGLGGVDVGMCMLADDADDWSAAFEGPVVRQDYVFWYREAT